jgi:hypothetical protein
MNEDMTLEEIAAALQEEELAHQRQLIAELSDELANELAQE